MRVSHLTLTHPYKVLGFDNSMNECYEKRTPYQKPQRQTYTAQNALAKTNGILSDGISKTVTRIRTDDNYMGSDEPTP